MVSVNPSHTNAANTVFGKMLLCREGWGMRIEFVEADELHVAQFPRFLSGHRASTSYSPRRIVNGGGDQSRAVRSFAGRSQSSTRSAYWVTYCEVAGVAPRARVPRSSG